MNNKIGFGEVPFRDSEFGFTDDAAGVRQLFLSNYQPHHVLHQRLRQCDRPVYPGEIDEQLKSEVQHNLQPALGRVAHSGESLMTKLPFIPTTSPRGSTLVWVRNGWSTGDFGGFHRVCFHYARRGKQSEDRPVPGVPGVQQRPDAGGPAGDRSGNGYGTSGGERRRRYDGLYGFGICPAGGGANAASLLQMGQESQPQGPAAAAAPGTWSCSACGATGQHSKFCSECGAARPLRLLAGSAPPAAR